MLNSLRGPSRAPSLDYLEFESPNAQLPAQEAGRRATHRTPKSGQAPVGRETPASRGHGAPSQPDTNHTVHNLLEDLLVRGLSVTVGLQPGSPAGPALGLKPEGVVLYLPLVRECQGPPKLHVRVNRGEAPGTKPLQVCLSNSTVSFCTEWGASSCIAASEQGVRHRKFVETLPAGYSSSAVASTASQITEPAVAGSCIVQLISSCGSLLCFKADSTAPLENQLAHDVLCIFRAFDFDTTRLYGCLCAAVKEAPAHSQFEDVLNSLPLFALKTGCPSAGENGVFKEATAAPGTTAKIRAGTLARTAEDGVKERHALICAFRRFVFSAKEKGPVIASGIASGVECPSEGSSLGLDTTVPSEATAAVASVCGEASERCVKPRQDNLNIRLDANVLTKALNPYAAPFVPRTPFSTSGTFCGYTLLKSSHSAEGHCEGTTAAATAQADVTRAPAVPSKAAEGNTTNASPIPMQHLDSFKGSRGDSQGSPKQLLIGPQYAGKFQRCKKSSSATTQRVPKLEVPGSLRDTIPAMQEQESRQQQQYHQTSKQRHLQQLGLQSISWRRRSHSAPSGSPGSAAGKAKAPSKERQYTPSVMLGLRKHSLRLQQPCKAFHFVLQQQQLQRGPDEPPVTSFSPNAVPATAGAAAPHACSSPALGGAVTPCLSRPQNHEMFCAPPPPPLPRRQEGQLQHRRGHQQQLKKGQPSGCLGGSWDGFANAGPLLPLPKVAPSGPPLLPTPRGPPIAAVPFHQLEQGGLMTSYWGSAGPGPTGAATHGGVTWIPGSTGAVGGPPVRPLLCSPMHYDGIRAPLQTVLLQQRDLLQQQLQTQLQQRLLLQGVPSAVFPEKPGPPNPEHLRRATRASKSPRKGIGCPQQRRQKQVQQQQHQPLHSQDASNKMTAGERNDPLPRAFPLSNEAALQKLLGMVTSLLMSRSGCKELPPQQQ
ncbi:uncharacterized protein EMH_0004630 [Eimeria mitis]|uniref:Uncharacterized protein n=1 Tax=Eimeria mitis TaxID=44415 RepID=U6JY89_9EIME|nr:uncharacterized protein EMH_0004630 [Eimeria mitis]CDJ29731.1 hypothetical protein, conserved [Eimeria mitis]